MTEKPCESRKYSQETIAKLASWRRLYETDPHVSILFLSETLGISQTWLKGYMHNRGWKKTPEAKSAAYKLGHSIAVARRGNALMPARPTPKAVPRPTVFPSVFSFGAMRGYTVSSGGRILGEQAGSAA